MNSRPELFLFICLLIKNATTSDPTGFAPVSPVGGDDEAGQSSIPDVASNSNEHGLDVQHNKDSFRFDLDLVSHDEELTGSADYGDVKSHCSNYDDLACELLPAVCLDCTLNMSCIYGSRLNVSCSVSGRIPCKGLRTFLKTMTCRYCFLSPIEDYDCVKAACQAPTQFPHRYKTNCTVKDSVLCLGQRTFPKKVPCNWTSGYRWSTALILSITLGGFGADRFYLGHWQEGIGKLFSFGGLGVWTLVDVVLVSIGYLRPSDGSLYI